VFYIFLHRLLEYVTLKPGGEAKGNPQKPERTPVGDDMVQDPVCKVYVPVSRSVERRVDGRTVYFCSDDCASRYTKEIGG
jgi:YHS domain-containing protein